MYVIIGQGAAGTAAAIRLRELDSRCEITVITEEPDWFYSRILLTDFVGGKADESSVVLRTEEEFQERNIRCLMGRKVASVSPSDKRITLSDGQELSYEKLLLATGARPAVPPVPGADADGIYTLWTLQDARDIRAAAEKGGRAAIVGGGFIGLKLSIALQKAGVTPFILSGRRKRLMPNQLDEEGAKILAAHLESKGIQVINEGGVEEFAVEDGRVAGIRVNGNLYPCDFAVAGTGTRPSIALAEQAGLTTDRGIVVNTQLQTSDPDIYAAGDAAQIENVFQNETVSATWPSAVTLGRLAAVNMHGRMDEYDPYLNMNSVELAGMTVISAGRTEEAEGDTVLRVHDGDHYRKALFRDDRLAGFILIGQTEGAGVLVNQIQRQLKTEVNDLSAKAVEQILFTDLMR